MDDSSGYYEDWNFVNSLVTPKKPAEIDKNILPSRRLAYSNYRITTISLDSPLDSTSEDSGYFSVEPPRSSSNIYPLSPASTIPPESPHPTLAEVLSSNSNPNTTPTRPLPLPKPKSLLQALLEDDTDVPAPVAKRQFLKTEGFVPEARRYRRRAPNKSSQSTRKVAEPKQKRPGPYEEPWLNEVYWYNFNDYMKKNYYDVFASSIPYKETKIADPVQSMKPESTTTQESPVDESSPGSSHSVCSHPVTSVESSLSE
ncbi:hypothetical protein B9Z55_018597 [Caenorhabditis nigoni]|uniref:Uncharacterized protein n=1 Tax=Caenorhabditis nigoni TaxID=1611254 RepID=A0A2G5TEU4_9PELO|nr:hypothetical protein B9Z55_018597 [Caenorhabditis nigoni]